MEQREDEGPLHWFAHARAGDKGNSVNISVIPYHAGAYEHLLTEVTVDRVRTLLGHRAIGAVNRYEVPGLPALNFVIEDALEGGVNLSLGLDGHGKSLSFRILTMPVSIPIKFAHEAALE
ncbi:MAG: hypothetical protein GY948_21125 [Alphaproteobacteria bacterium]|nr:hypothetical protein [Alphaproteobacteria bacterium]